MTGFLTKGRVRLLMIFAVSIGVSSATLGGTLAVFAAQAASGRSITMTT